MQKAFARISCHTVLVCGVTTLGFQLPAQAQSLTTTSIPSAVVGTVRNGATFTIHIANSGPGEAFGVVLKFTPPKGSKIAIPNNCFVTSKSSGAVQCMLGYIASPGTQQVNLKISATRAGTYNTSFAASCTAAACSGGQLTVPVALN
jgi:hypothetical protein